MADDPLTRRQVLTYATTAAATLAAAGQVASGQPATATATNPATRPSNDSVALTPRTTFDAGRKLAFDFPGLRIGCAEYDEGPTGCTVFHFPRGATAVADIRGGAHCSIYMDYLADGAGGVDAICLAGGSFYGLEAATGVAAELLAQRDYRTAFHRIALVSGAIIDDFGPRDNAIYPDKALGRAALRASAEGSFPLGERGAGRSATCGKWHQPPLRYEHAGQGAAFAQDGNTKLAVFTVVNAVGSLVGRDGNVVRGSIDPRTGRRPRVAEMTEAAPPSQPATAPAELLKGNTTLTVLVTNRKMSGGALRQLARQVHGSMHRAIDPFHTSSDGDILFAVTTDEVEPQGSNGRLAVIASELAWDAVLNSFDT